MCGSAVVAPNVHAMKYLFPKRYPPCLPLRPPVALKNETGAVHQEIVARRRAGICPRCRKMTLIRKTVRARNSSRRKWLARQGVWPARNCINPKVMGRDGGGRYAIPNGGQISRVKCVSVRSDWPIDKQPRAKARHAARTYVRACASKCVDGRAYERANVCEQRETFGAMQSRLLLFR